MSGRRINQTYAKEAVEAIFKDARKMDVTKAWHEVYNFFAPYVFGRYSPEKKESASWTVKIIERTGYKAEYDEEKDLFRVWARDVVPRRSSHHRDVDAATTVPLP